MRVHDPLDCPCTDGADHMPECAHLVMLKVTGECPYCGEVRG